MALILVAGSEIFCQMFTIDKKKDKDLVHLIWQLQNLTNL